MKKWRERQIFKKLNEPCSFRLNKNGVQNISLAGDEMTKTIHSCLWTHTYLLNLRAAPCPHPHFLIGKLIDNIERMSKLGTFHDIHGFLWNIHKHMSERQDKKVACYNNLYRRPGLHASEIDKHSATGLENEVWNWN